MGLLLQGGSANIADIQFEGGAGNKTVVIPKEELAAQLQEQANAEARAKLGSLDWKVIRELERLMLSGTDLNLEREALRVSVV